MRGTCAHRGPFGRDTSGLAPAGQRRRGRSPPPPDRRHPSCVPLSSPQRGCRSHPAVTGRAAAPNRENRERRARPARHALGKPGIGGRSGSPGEPSRQPARLRHPAAVPGTRHPGLRCRYSGRNETVPVHHARALARASSSTATKRAAMSSRSNFSSATNRERRPISICRAGSRPSSTSQRAALRAP